MQYTLSHPISISCPLIKIKWKLNLRIFWILSFVSILGLLVLYIFQVNSLAREVFLIEAYQKRLKELSENNEILAINLAKSSSLEYIENFLQNENFQKVKVKYIQILESSIVKNK